MLHQSKAEAPRTAFNQEKKTYVACSRVNPRMQSLDTSLVWSLMLGPTTQGCVIPCWTVRQNHSNQKHAHTDIYIYKLYSYFILHCSYNIYTYIRINENHVWSWNWGLYVLVCFRPQAQCDGLSFHPSLWDVQVCVWSFSCNLLSAAFWFQHSFSAYQCDNWYVSNSASRWGCYPKDWSL